MADEPVPVQEPEDAGHTTDDPDYAELLELHQILEYTGEIPVEEASSGPGPDQATALTLQDTGGADQ